MLGAYKLENPEYKKVLVQNLIPYVRNSRTHSDDQVTQIAASIREFGFTNPVLVDDKNNVIAGHGRILAAKKLGLTEIPAIELRGLTDAQKKAYVIADNKLALNAGWDDEMLRVEFQELEEVGFDLELVGFSADEMATIMCEIDDIVEVESFNDTFNFSVTCSDLAELEMVKRALGVSGKKIDASKLLEVVG